MSVLLAFTAAVLFATGTFLLLQRRLSRILIGIGLVGHGDQHPVLTRAAAAAIAPVIGTADPSEFADPLPQALALTSIVITFGVTAFLLALGLPELADTHDDVVEDDIEDSYVARRAGRRDRRGRRGGRAGPGRRGGPGVNALIPLPMIVPVLGAALGVPRRRSGGCSGSSCSPYSRATSS